MIIIPEYKIILIQPYKTASSSLSKAILSSINIHDGENEIEYRKKILKLSLNSKGCALPHNNTYFAHTPAAIIKNIIHADIWDNYLKISTVRCPYDSMISWYYWHHATRGRPHLIKQFTLFIYDQINIAIQNYTMLSVNNKSIIDFIIKYENFNEDIKKLENRINCPGLAKTLHNNKIHSQYRPSGQDIYTVYARYPLARAIIDEYFANNMKNELIQEYYPLYKKQIDLKLGESKHFYKAIAKTLYKNRKMLALVHKLLGFPLYYRDYIYLFRYKAWVVKNKIKTWKKP